MMGWGNMMGDWGYGPGAYSYGGSWFGLLGMVLQFVFWIVLIVIVFKMFRTTNSKAAQEQIYSNNEALEILKIRYAKGEIDTEEYNQRKTGLEH